MLASYKNLYTVEKNALMKKVLKMEFKADGPRMKDCFMQKNSVTAKNVLEKNQSTRGGDLKIR